MGYSMRYDDKSDRWVVDLDNGSEYPLHCGDGFSIYFSNVFIQCSIEFGGEWYVYISNVKFNLRKQEKYRVLI